MRPINRYENGAELEVQLRTTERIENNNHKWVRKKPENTMIRTCDVG